MYAYCIYALINIIHSYLYVYGCISRDLLRHTSHTLLCFPHLEIPPGLTCQVMVWFSNNISVQFKLICRMVHLAKMSYIVLPSAGKKSAMTASDTLCPRSWIWSQGWGGSVHGFVHGADLRPFSVAWFKKSFWVHDHLVVIRIIYFDKELIYTFLEVRVQPGPHKYRY